MVYLPQVVKAKHVSGFIIATRFDDGTEKYVDISQWFKGPVFRALKEPTFFGRFFVEGGTLAWPNGVDIAPEALYSAADIRVSLKKTRPGVVARRTPTRQRGKRSLHSPAIK